jgi:hypothetical protein
MDHEIAFKFNWRTRLQQIKFNIIKAYMWTTDNHLKQMAKNFKLLVFKSLSMFLLEWMHTRPKFILKTQVHGMVL